MAQGSIQKRILSNGKTAYLVRVELPPDPTIGKRRQRSKQVATRKAADVLLATWLSDVERGTAVDPARLTVADWLREWLPAHRAAKRLRLTTYTSYEMNLRVHIIPVLGHVPLQRLTAKQVQDFYVAKLAEERGDGKNGGLAPRSVRYMAMILRQALQRAYELQLVGRNVADVVKPPSVPRHEPLSWTPALVRRFLTLLDEEYYGPALLLYVTTGLRRGEVLGLRWQDLDLDVGTLSVRQALTEVKGKLYLGPPKTITSKREVPLALPVLTALAEHRKRQIAQRLAAGAAWVDHALVFCTPLGEPIHPRNLYRRYSQIVERAGLPRLSVHGLRHTFASLLYADTKDLLLVSKVLGHAQPSTTANIYAHLLPHAEQRAAVSIARTLFEDRDADEAASTVNFR